MSDSNNNNSGGFAKTTDFKWLGIGILIFVLIGFIMPTPQSMLDKAVSHFPTLSESHQAFVGDDDRLAVHIKLTMALLATCVVFFATEAVPMPAVALLIGLVQLFFGITSPSMLAKTYAHDAVWFIAGSLALGATLVKYGLDKRVGMLVVNLAGTKTRSIVIGILLGTAIPTAFVGEHAVAAMYVPIALALYTLTNKSTPAPNLGTLLMVTIAVGCMIGGPMSPTGGARNALMIGFLANIGVEVSFVNWLSMGVFYTFAMAIVMAFLLPVLFTGFSAIGIVPDDALGRPGEVLPYLITHHLTESGILYGIVGAGALAAAMSSSDAITHGASVSFGRDICKVIFPSLKENQELWIMRLAVIGVGAISYCIAIYGSDGLIALLLGAYGAIVQLAPGVYSGLFWKKASTLGVIIGLIVGIIVTIYFQYIAASSPYDLHPGLIGVLLNIAIVIFVSVIQQQNEENYIHASKFVDE